MEEKVILKLINRENELFQEDLKKFDNLLREEISKSSFLVIGGAGSIGSATVKEIFKRNPKVLHVVDINENGLVELVRDIRSSLGYINGDFRTFCVDVGSEIFNNLVDFYGSYDYILNFSALKHVRSEKDPFTLMRMIEVNILNTIKTLEISIEKGSKKYFCVSTDKAANPVNMMGASKRIMELFLMKYSKFIDISTARFANVAFSQGSLLDGFTKRIEKRQPLAAPIDVRRYFMTPKESGILCLMSTVLGENKEIFFPKLSEELHMIKFSDIAIRFLELLGYEPYICSTEEEARKLSKELPEKGKWPCYFFESDTTGEKEYEEFYTENEVVKLDKFIDIGIIKYSMEVEESKLKYFLQKVNHFKENYWTKKDLVDLFKYLLPNFLHKETGKYLDQKM